MSLYWLAYIVFAAIHLILVLFQYETAVYYSRFFLVPVLMLAYFKSTALKSVVHKLVFAGLFCGALGDAALVQDDESLFIAGLGCFLIGHLFYIAAFQTEIKRTCTEEKSVVVFLYMLILIGVLLFLFPYLGEMKLPVIIYSAVLMLMSCMAFMRWDKSEKRSSLWIFSGSIAFVISDFMIASDKFYQPFDSSQLLILLTYLFAQFGIAYGTSPGSRKDYP